MDISILTDLALSLFYLSTVCKSQGLSVKYCKAELHEGGDYCHRVHYDDKDSIYVFGGCEHEQDPFQILKYSLESDIISQIGKLPLSFSSGSLQMDGTGNLLLFGANYSNNQVIKYDIRDNTASVVATLPWDIRDRPTVTLGSNNIALIFGSKVTSKRYKMLDFNMQTWKVTEPTKMLPIDPVYCSAIQFNNRVFLVPAKNYGSGSVWEMNVNSLEMFPVGQPNLPYLNFPSLVTDGIVIYIIAGIGPNPTPFPSREGILRFDPQNNATDFIPVRNWPVNDGGRYFINPPQCAFAAKLNRIYCFGGKSDDGKGFINSHQQIFYMDMSSVPSTTLEPFQTTGLSGYSSTEQTTEVISTTDGTNNQSSENKWKLGAIIGGILGFLLLVALVIACVCHKIKTSDSRNNIMEIMYNDFKYGLRSNFSNLDPDETNYYRALGIPFPKSLEILPQRLKIDKDVILGRGAFGIVFKGMLDEEMPVAVKSVPKNVDESKLEALLSEVKIMNYVGKHSNVVQLLGVQIVDLKKGLIFVALEFCSAGSLESVLQKKKAQLQTESGIYQIPGYFIDKPFSTRDLLTFSLQVCFAMEFLVSKGIVHGDLATRNVLLDGNYTAKISDFGLSRKIYECKNYATASKDTALPFRWLAIETLNTFKFSYASDCWAFGVFMWEVFSLADLPYSAAVHWSSEFIDFLESGSRLKCPKYATDEIHELMNLCWDASPSQRPTFQTLSSRLLEILEIEPLEQ